MTKFGQGVRRKGMLPYSFEINIKTNCSKMIKLIFHDTRYQMISYFIDTYHRNKLKKNIEKATKKNKQITKKLIRG